MNKNLKIFIGITIILLGIVAVFTINTQQEIVKIGPAAIVQPELEIGSKAVLTIDGISAIELEVEKDSTAFDLLQQAVEKSGLEMEIKQYNIGVFIEAIGDKKNGQDGKYWLYYINGEMPVKAVDKMLIKSGDKIEFKFET